MSFELNWPLLDDALADVVRNALNAAFASAKRPAYLGETVCTSFAWGSEPPDIELVDIRDIGHEFADEDDEPAAWPSPMMSSASQLHGSSLRSSVSRPPTFAPSSFAPPFHRSPSPEPDTASGTAPSLQLHVHVAYGGSLRIGLETSLVVNYPAPAFMTLPLSLAVVGLAFAGTFVVAFEGGRRRVHVSVLDPASEGELDVARPGTGGRAAGKPGERLLTGLRLQSQVGEVDKHVLRNVGKVQQFVLEVIRTALEVRHASRRSTI